MAAGIKRVLRASGLLLALAACAVGSSGAHAAAHTGVTAAAISSDADWILQAQLPDGAIATWTDQQRVSPYLASYAAIGLARASEVTGDRPYVSAAWRWLRWYQAHENAHGYVTDYLVSGGRLVSTRDMDSTDAYAGVFLMATGEAWRATNDRAQLAGLKVGIGGAVKAIESTQGSDGLTWAKPTWHVEYLMDESEAYGGLRAAAVLANALRMPKLALRAADAAARMKSGFATLWDRRQQAYDWALHEDGYRHPTNWSILYPDSLEEMWPVAMGLVDGLRARELVDRFAATQPNWAQPDATALFSLGFQDVGYWGVAGWAFSRAGDSTTSASAATSIRTAALHANRAWPFTPSDAGQLIVLATGGYTG